MGSNKALFCVALLVCLVAAFVHINAQAVSSTQGTPVALSQADIQTLLDLHNAVRTSANLTGSGKTPLPRPNPELPSLVWDPALTNVWGSSYTKNCVFGHTENGYRSQAGGKGTNYVGENLAWYSNRASLTSQFALWYGEHKDYTFIPLGSGSGGPQTGHYTQLIWKDTTYVGCSYVNCVGTSLGGYLLACDYYSGGNYMGNTPYKCDGFVKTCAELGLNCGDTYVDYCGTDVRGVYPNTPCGGCTPATSPSNTPSISTTRTAAPSLSNSKSVSESSAPSNTADPSDSRTPSTSESNTASPTSAASDSSSPSPLSASESPSNFASTSRTPSSSITSSLSDTPSSSGEPSPAASTTPSESITPSIVPPSPDPSPSCLLLTCASLGNLQCGSYYDSCGGSMDCGTCSSGSTCKSGICVAVGCNPPCSEPSQTCSTDTNTCVCSPGYSALIPGKCQNLKVLSENFPFVPYFNSEPNYWVEQTDESMPAEIDLVQSDGIRRGLLWQNSEQYSSQSNTTVSGSFYTGSQTVSLGIGSRLGQPKYENDSVEWRFDISNGQANVYYTDYIFGSRWNRLYVGSAQWDVRGWNNISVTTVLAKPSTIYWNVTLNGRYYFNVYFEGAVPGYLGNLGKIYFTGNNALGIRQLSLSTETTMVVTISGCMSPEAWARFVSTILGANTRVTQSTNFGCSNQLKRQAGAAGTSVFTFSISDGAMGESSLGLSSQLISMANNNDPVFASQGISINSIAVTPEIEVVDSTAVLLAATVPSTVGAAAGGLSTGAIIGIVVGGTAGVLLGLGALAAVVAVVVVVVRKGRTDNFKNEVHMEEVPRDEEAPAPKKKREGVDVFDPVDRRQSVTGRKLGNVIG